MKATSKKPITFSPTEEYLLALLRACLNQTDAPEKPEAVSWNALFYAAKQQSVAAIVYTAVKKLKVQPQGETLATWSEWYDKLLTKSINQSVEAQRLLEAFNRKKIRIMPLKGYYLQQLYPSPELREMSDIDFLVDNDRSDGTQALMSQLGYTMRGRIVHEAEYVKKPYVIVELHCRLTPGDTAIDRIQEPWDYALTENEQMPFVKKQTATDFFIYQILHFQKHLKNGSGIRNAIDLYVLLRACADQIDWAVAEQALAKNDAFELYKTASSLCRTWFSDGISDDKQKELAMYLLRNSTYGSKRQFEANKIYALSGKNKIVAFGKWRFFLGIVFPPKEEMERMYPCLKRFGILLPFFWLRRGIKTIFKNPKHIKQYYNRIMKTDVTNAEAIVGKGLQLK